MTFGAGIVAILLPIIISGYLLLNAKFIMLMMPKGPGSNRYFRILLVGFVWCFIVAMVACGSSCFDMNLDGNSNSDKWWLRPAAQVGILSIASALCIRGVDSLLFPLSRALWILMNKQEEQEEREYNNDYWFYLRMLEKEARFMEVFIWRSMVHNDLIMLTLDNSKVYVGLATVMTMTKDVPEWLEIIPMLSGYREEKDKRTEITSRYIALEKDEEFSEKFNMSNLKMILPVRKIVSFQGFHHDVHEKIRSQRTGAGSSSSGLQEEAPE